MLILNEMTTFRKEQKSRIQIVNGFYDLTRKCKKRYRVGITLSFFRLLSFILFKVILIPQMCFGIFPVDGLRHRSSSRLSFNLKSFCFIYSTLVQCGIVLMFTTSIFKQLNSRIEYSKIGEYNFSTNFFS